VTFKQIKTLDGKKETSQELRIVELIKGEWKMVNHTSMPASTSSVKEELPISEKDKKPQLSLKRNNNSLNHEISIHFCKIEFYFVKSI
jgi:hypothetical protein